MKKVIIISYFYPPSIFVGGQRIESWAKELHKHGYYPIIITRNWNEGQTTLTEPIDNNSLKIERCNDFEIHRLPFRRSLRDKIASKPFLKVLQKVLTLWEIILSNYSVNTLPYSNFYSYTKDILKANRDIKIVITSGRPFQLFHIGSKLKTDLNISWVADYRDEWNSHQRIEPKGFLRKLLFKLESKSEKKWLRNVDLFTSVSEQCVSRIEAFTNKKGAIVRNGFDKIEESSEKDPNKLKILYAGTLYPYQDLSIITDSILELDNYDIEFTIIGGFDDQLSFDWYQKLKSNHPDNFKLIHKIPKKEFTNQARKMDIGLLTKYKNLDGCLPVKVFDYYSCGLEILLCPSDDDLMKDFIINTNSGTIVNSKTECKSYLTEMLELKRQKRLQTKRDFSLGTEYSRSHQTSILAKYLDQLK